MRVSQVTNRPNTMYVSDHVQKAEVRLSSQQYEAPLNASEGLHSAQMRVPTFIDRLRLES